LVSPKLGGLLLIIFLARGAPAPPVATILIVAQCLENFLRLRNLQVDWAIILDFMRPECEDILEEEDYRDFVN
jgi:hypothetical protein